ncbi:exodeoxyribonuclease VII large subunit [Bibersteinia trehalosi]|nr:exodeoxyribonuclease VII large subunit [Bibersteinia trehalosi]
MQNTILTVSQLNYTARHLLESELGQIWLMGEVSNLSKPVSGHWYLTLKDEQAQVRCAMFRMKNMRVNFPVQNGMQVLVRASVSLYEPRGDYQVIIDSMQPAGDGLLQQQFEQLKMKLAGEGLFAQEHKKPLPDFVKRVGVITSSSGAALQDILNVLNRRDPSLQVVIYPTLVQGKEAAQEIAEMIQLANLRQECDVLIVGRGGGSLEDLWCFNEEVVAYAVYHSSLPIISAVGHETDVTICDFVADLRAPTPSAAAELVSRDQMELARRLQQQLDKASFAFDCLWGEKIAQFERLQLRLNAQHPTRQISAYQQYLLQMRQQAVRTIYQQSTQGKRQLENLTQRLVNQHPQRRLASQQMRLVQLNQQLEKRLLQVWQAKQQCWQNLQQRLENNPLPYQLAGYHHQTNQLQQRLDFAMQRHFSQRAQAFQALCVKLEGLSPLKILARGYSVTQDQHGKALLSTQAVKIGEKITSKLAEGQIISEVIAIK